MGALIIAGTWLATLLAWAGVIYIAVAMWSWDLSWQGDVAILLGLCIMALLLAAWSLIGLSLGLRMWRIAAQRQEMTMPWRLPC